jgi:hypothetical protein
MTETRLSTDLKYFNTQYPEYVTKMSAQNFIDTLELKIYIESKDEVHNRVKKQLFIFHGDTNTGKSTLLNKIYGLFCSNNWNVNIMSSFGMDLLPTFALSPMLTLAYDTGDKLGQIKELLGNDSIYYRKMFQTQKYLNPICNIIIQCKHLPESRLVSCGTVINFKFNIPKQIKIIQESILDILRPFLIDDLIKISQVYYHCPEEFTPIFKTILTCNEKPIITDGVMISFRKIIFNI